MPETVGCPKKTKSFESLWSVSDFGITLLKKLSPKNFNPIRQRLGATPPFFFCAYPEYLMIGYFGPFLR